MSKRSVSNGKKANKYIKKMVIDSGNPRYAASVQSSFAGGLITGTHVKNQFAIPVDLPKPQLQMTIIDEMLLNGINNTQKFKTISADGTDQNKDIEEVVNKENS